MNLNIVAVGKLREAYYKAGVEDYLSRIRHFLPIEQIEVPQGGTDATNGQVQNVMNREAAAIEKAIPKGSFIVVLDSGGKNMTSEEFSGWFEERMVNSVSRITFVIGGAWGIAPNFLENANLKLSLSAMTFPHELARLVLTEQIYRALSLWKNLPYHK